jgi:hypothetical protein
LFARRTAIRGIQQRIDGLLATEMIGENPQRMLGSWAVEMSDLSVWVRVARSPLHGVKRTGEEDERGFCWRDA